MIEGVSIEHELERHGSYASVTKGYSMAPLFKTHRDVVIIEKPQREIRRLDVVLYRGSNEKEYVLHRVIRVKGDLLIIRGDNNFFKELLTKDKIVGVLTQFNRNGKEATVNDLGYRLYSHLWYAIYPLRYAKHLFCRIARKIYKVIFKRKNR
jgi:signal peptidase I